MIMDVKKHRCDMSSWHWPGLDGEYVARLHSKEQLPFRKGSGFLELTNLLHTRVDT